MSAFTHVGMNKPRRSVFNLSHQRKFDAEMMKLYPIMVDEMVPGDHFRISNKILARVINPLVAPMMHDVKLRTEYFFVPYRILWDDWETFISRGVDGDTSLTVPTWPLNSNGMSDKQLIQRTMGEGSLWDYIGFPVFDDTAGEQNYSVSALKDKALWPVDFPRRAYLEIWNEYYRDENYLKELDYKSNPNDMMPYYELSQNMQGYEHACGTDGIFKRAWRKDYFTSALPWQQRGTPPAIPLSGFSQAEYDYFSSDDEDLLFYMPSSLDDNGNPVYGNTHVKVSAGKTDNDGMLNDALRGIILGEHEGRDDPVPDIDTRNIAIHTYNRLNEKVNNILNDNIVDFSSIGTFTPSDLRLAFQVQKWQERNSRAGVRYKELLLAHFGTAPRDERLQRPEFIGSSTQPLYVSEVLQTSSTDETSPQGTLAGHGISVDGGSIGSYYAQEYGLIFGIFSIVPSANYQQGMPRQWTRKTNFDYFWPEFVALSEQDVQAGELIWNSQTVKGEDIFGYQGRYNEMRYKPSTVHGKFRSQLDFWHLGRKFGYDTVPKAGSWFIYGSPSKRVFSVFNEPAFGVDLANIVRAVRPIPISAEPGLIDHF